MYKGSPQEKFLQSINYNNKSISAFTIMLKVDNVSRSYGDQKILSNISFALPSGRSCALIGPNGSGKTTMLNTISGLLPLQSGHISINDCSIKNQKQYLYKISTLVQSTYVEIGLTARQSIRIVCGLNGHYPTKNDIENALERLEILQYADIDFRMLSGGCKRRVMLAYTLLKPCDLLLLDEPTSSIDPALRRIVWDWIVEIKKRGTSLILASHYSDEILACADDIYIIKDGNVFDIGNKVLDGIIVNIEGVQNMPQEIPFQHLIQQSKCQGVYSLLAKSLKDVINFLHVKGIQYDKISVDDNIMSRICEYMSENNIS